MERTTGINGLRGTAGMEGCYVDNPLSRGFESPVAPVSVLGAVPYEVRKIGMGFPEWLLRAKARIQTFKNL